ncbi:MAG: dihydrofolate reductase [Candidatus Syntrophosphaera sp.]
MTEHNISLIWAMDRNRLIGINNRLPWKIPEDLAWFRSKTLNHTVIMGKNTWFSLGKPLPERTNVILSHDRELSAPGAIVCHDPRECLAYCNQEECFVIGGAQVFKLFLPLASKLYVTIIDAEFEGDTYFPQIDLDQWETLYYERRESRLGYHLTFTEYRRIKNCGFELTNDCVPE